MKKIFCVFVLAVVFALSSCATTGVTRMDANTQTDLSGYWNDTDVRIVCEALIKDCLTSARVNQAIDSMGRKTPVVLVGSFRNESSEHIDTNIIASRMETVIFNTGKMDFVAGGKIRDELRAERNDQMLGYTSDATAASIGKETGANFMLFGTVRTIIDKSGNTTIRSYIVNAELTNLETNQRLWMGENNEIKKKVVRAKNKL